VRGFRGDGLAVIQKATFKSDIGVLKATGFVLGPQSNFAEIEVPASVLASLLPQRNKVRAVEISLNDLDFLKSKDFLQKNKLSDMRVF
jgi:hypothetical protein